MATITLKQQEIHAGGFIVRIGMHGDMERTSFIQIVGRSEGHTLLFNAEGSLLKINPSPLPVYTAPVPSAQIASPSVSEQTNTSAQVHTSEGVHTETNPGKLAGA